MRFYSSAGWIRYRPGVGREFVLIPLLCWACVLLEAETFADYKKLQVFTGELLRLRVEPRWGELKGDFGGWKNFNRKTPG